MTLLTVATGAVDVVLHQGSRLLLYTFFFAIAFLLLQIAYYCLLHPLSRFPGPKLWAASRLTYLYHLWSGHFYVRIQELHDKYGPVVRIAPNELSFIDEDAFQGIYCGGNGNKGFQKYDVYRLAGDFTSIFDADDDEHTRLRNIIKNRFFSLRVVREQEVIVQGYVDRLIAQLRAHHCNSRATQGHMPIDSKKPADIRSWYNWTTLDILGRIAFTEDFGCLENGAPHPWLVMLEPYLKLSTLAMSLLYYPPLPLIVSKLAPGMLSNLQEKFLFHLRDKISRRINRVLPPGKEDFVTIAVGEQTEEHHDGDEDDSDKRSLMLTPSQLEAHSLFLCIAGSETVASVLLGATHLLCENPKILKRLTTEVRSAAANESDISSHHAAMSMPYLTAVLKESMRMCPPLTFKPSRVVGKDGAVIAGHFVPPETVVGVSIWAANHSATNFARSNEFIPERWLTREQAVKYAGNAFDYDQFATDARDATKPFSVGGRDCLGQNLAWVELRLILARLLWNFDLQVCYGKGDEAGKESSQARAFRNWTDQEAYVLWKRECYSVFLSERL